MDLSLYLSIGGRICVDTLRTHHNNNKFLYSMSNDSWYLPGICFLIPAANSKK